MSRPKGFKMSAEHKQKLRESNKRAWANDPERRKKISEGRLGDKNWAKRPEVRAKIAKTVALNWRQGAYENRINGMLGKKGPDSPTFKGYVHTYANFLSQFQSVEVCSRCGEGSKKIDVHHVDEDHQNWLPTNLMPLCVKCHHALHAFAKTPFVTLTRIFEMDSAHHLCEYDGACQNLHGHHYFLIVSIRRRIDPQTGMVLDYGELKQVVNGAVVSKLDHAYINQVLGHDKTTCENILPWIWQQLEQVGLLKGIIRLELKETPMTSCAVEATDMLEWYRNGYDTSSK